MKNGRNAVMESITRKLEAQSIQVRAVEPPQNGRCGRFYGPLRHFGVGNTLKG